MRARPPPPESAPASDGHHGLRIHIQILTLKGPSNVFRQSDEEATASMVITTLNIAYHKYGVGSRSAL